MKDFTSPHGCFLYRSSVETLRRGRTLVTSRRHKHVFTTPYLLPQNVTMLGSCWRPQMTIKAAGGGG